MAESDSCLMCGERIGVAAGPGGRTDVPDFCGACFAEMQPRVAATPAAGSLGDVALAALRVWRSRRLPG